MLYLSNFGKPRMILGRESWARLGSVTRDREEGKTEKELLLFYGIREGKHDFNLRSVQFFFSESQNLFSILWRTETTP